MSENSGMRAPQKGYGDEAIRPSDLRPLLAALTAARDGTFAHVPIAADGIVGELGATFNQLADRSVHFNAELARVRREITRHGRLDERLEASPGQGAWVTRVGDVNTIIDALVAPAANAT